MLPGRFRRGMPWPIRLNRSYSICWSGSAPSHVLIRRSSTSGEHRARGFRSGRKRTSVASSSAITRSVTRRRSRSRSRGWPTSKRIGLSRDRVRLVPGRRCSCEEAAFAVRSRTRSRGSTRRHATARATRVARRTLPPSTRRRRSGAPSSNGYEARTCSARSSRLRASVAPSAVSAVLNASRIGTEARPSRCAWPRWTRIRGRRRERTSGFRAKCRGSHTAARSLPSKAGKRALLSGRSTPPLGGRSKRGSGPGRDREVSRGG